MYLYQSHEATAEKLRRAALRQMAAVAKMGTNFDDDQQAVRHVRLSLASQFADIAEKVSRKECSPLQVPDILLYEAEEVGNEVKEAEDLEKSVLHNLAIEFISVFTGESLPEEVELSPLTLLAAVTPKPRDLTSVGDLVEINVQDADEKFLVEGMRMLVIFNTGYTTLAHVALGTYQRGAIFSHCVSIDAFL